MRRIHELEKKFFIGSLYIYAFTSLKKLHNKKLTTQV